MAKSDRYENNFIDDFESEDLSEFQDDYRHDRESHRRNVRRKIEDYSERRRLKRDCDTYLYDT